MLDPVEDAIADIAAGKPVVVVDDEDRENEGDIIFAAAKATPEVVAFTVRHSSGYICAAVPDSEADRLGLPPMVARNEDVRGTAYTVTVDAAEGITTGISAHDRAHTLRLLADPESTRESFHRPGHVVPLRARRGGVLERGGHTEASVDLARAAGLPAAGVLCEVVSEEDPSGMARLPELRRFCDTHGLSLISIEQLADWRRVHTPVVTRNVESRLPTRHGDFHVVGYTGLIDGVEHIALVAGDVADDDGQDVLVRVHSECLTGDIFGSRRCDCGEQLSTSLDLIAEAGRGVLVYLRGQEGRGIGLVPKLRAYNLQDEGLDTVDANTAQGLPVDTREYSAAAQILTDLGVNSVALMSNNPEKRLGLERHGIPVVRRIPVELPSNPENEAYLRTKRDRMGHQLDSLSVPN
ncbi:MAG: bifunctional 3,4-dihydroxy-2-butanone-4-phosphate synthase/GTP cyclohydrolase II [Corynebacterium sp.]|uniref:bifunctional 3,4-dihydroxy-2-butanone-4-phosphate synthase/GTP cyclohydrolase II n=1 Tax=Corynebacterium sp. TaxID=1720 RepID=UPI002648F09A|nr:bifunctional 3,4-dihydroxy-2-butanone-4-phosphate synthase/GTP cyclohydrolase II [Corynebacterium sp.]MDN5722338.1 bifunctional 3,4-dihydroxy-2-butanone-4-phosphate synthase/GTP cyclohydrolase II [Corynebacterium sp.]MDN6282479.1 bifunctional 3,4-dihydroxy-2-butanone-4-phosphate synthase/GTP cyclohydrolase II [Corynebacterium sp.]MDN6305100.1 bifunctional 3,4-dihydroxy-2-butanone-4-phosphate synthase/GTP cyclohydrolase II [Corynebacterium sp.]MDN6366632.1 bifunctional 3,4-dihydroxy-2-butanon